MQVSRRHCGGRAQAATIQRRDALTDEAMLKEAADRPAALIAIVRMLCEWIPLLAAADAVSVFDSAARTPRIAGNP